MQIGDTVYNISDNVIATIEDVDGEIFIMKMDTFEIVAVQHEDLLTLEECANIFANKELERMVLNYKK